MDEITIKIYVNSDGDYNYDIYDTINDVEEDEISSLDGGTYTGDTMAGAIEMATEHAIEFLKTYKK